MMYRILPVTGEDYTATLQTYTISGTIKNGTPCRRVP